jgi:tetratricopeptide (TPR) repeat protein
MSIDFRRLVTAILLMGVFFAPAASFADDSGSWAGQKIMTKMPGTLIGHTNLFGRHVYVAELTDLVYTVQREQDGWVHLRQRGVEGWLYKEQAVLLEDAIAYFSLRIRANNQDAFAFAYRGRAWKEEGELEKALQDLNDAIRLNPFSPVGFSNRGMVYDELQEYDNAIRDYDEALRRDPRDALTYNNRGIVYKAKRDYDQAIRDYSLAIRFDPRSSDAYFNRGNAFKARKEYDMAVSDYSQAVRLDPEWPDAYFNRANANKARKAYDQAASDYSQVIRLDAKDADAYSNLAWLLATCPDGRVRNGQKAVEYATKACELTSWKSSYVLATLGVAYAEMGRFEEATRWQKKALESSQYEKEEGEQGRQRIVLFQDHLPYREN